MSYKHWTLIALVFVVSVVFWLALRPWLADPLNISWDGHWLEPLLSLVVLITLVCLANILLKHGKLDLLVLGGVLLPYWLAFVWPNTTTFLAKDWYYYISGGVIGTLCMLYGAEQIHKIKRQQSCFNLHHVARSGLYAIITGLLLMISLAYYLSPVVQNTAKRDELSASTRQTVQVITLKLVGDRVDNPAEQSAFRRAFVESWGQLNNFLRPYFYLLPPILAIGLFLILNGLSFLFYYPALLLVWLLWKILLATKLVNMEKTMIEVEIPKF